MTERVYLHVGAPKSGTTYLQAIMESNRALLAERGVLVVGNRRIDRVHAAMVVRADRRLDQLPAAASRAWDRLVAQIGAWPGPVAILSYELFAGAGEEQAAKAIAELQALPGNPEVHVVISARNFGTALASAWQERLKFALTTPLADFEPDKIAGPRAEWGWRTMDPAGVAKRWGATLPPEQVHIVTVPRSGGGATVGPYELWHRFAAACGLDSTGLELDQERVNESMGVVEAELLRRINEVVGAPITGNREHARWLRDTLAHRVLAGLGEETIGITDAQDEDARERSAEAIAELAGSGVDVQGDLEDLRARAKQARGPDEVTDAELLDSAVRAIAQLLYALRESAAQVTLAKAAVPPPAAPIEPEPSGNRVRRAIVAGSAPVAELRRRKLESRVEDLERQLREARAIEQRVAELGDVVMQVLLPAADRNQQALANAIRDYRTESL